MQGARDQQVDALAALPPSKPQRLPSRASYARALSQGIRICVAQALLALLLALTADAADPSYLEALIQRARQLRLAESREWALLLHYQPRWLRSSVRSLVDAKDFFNAPNGKDDPAAELEATLIRFFASAPNSERDEHPQCAFIARYQWLKQQLRFDSQRLPEHPCPLYDAWLSAIDPQGVTLIFPVAYLNNPPSMFGHTLLRIDAAAHTEQTRLLDFTVNFAAQTNEARGVIYAIKGVWGAFPGRFSVSRYHRKVKEYSDIENRDIWEYELTLDLEETRRLLMHVWELRSAHFDYFFHRENCSYQLLSLIEVARPSLRLTEQFPWQAIPSDTVRAVTTAPGLLKQLRYRPSRSTVLRHRLYDMDDRLQDIAQRLAAGEITSEGAEMVALTPVEQAQALELALDYLSYRKHWDEGLSTRQERTTLALLKMRSALKVPDQLPHIQAPDVRPDQGHKTSRLGVTFGLEDDAPFVGLQYRHAYHDLLDPAGGYPPGAQLEFLHVELRYDPNRGKINLERFRLIDLLSTPLRDRFLKPWSWKVNIGAQRKRFADRKSAIVGEANGGLGVSYRLSKRGTIYAFGEGVVGLSDRFHQRIAIAVGSSAGILWDVSSRWRVGLSGRFLRYIQGIAANAHQIGFDQMIELTRQSAITIEMRQSSDFGKAFITASLSWKFYF